MQNITLVQSEILIHMGFDIQIQGRPPKKSEWHEKKKQIGISNPKTDADVIDNAETFRKQKKGKKPVPEKISSFQCYEEKREQRQLNYGDQTKNVMEFE